VVGKMRCVFLMVQSDIRTLGMGPRRSVRWGLLVAARRVAAAQDGGLRSKGVEHLRYEEVVGVSAQEADQRAGVVVPEGLCLFGGRGRPRCRGVRVTECLPGVFEVAAGEPDGVRDQVCWAISALRSGLGESCCGAQWLVVAGSPTDGAGPIARADACGQTY